MKLLLVEPRASGHHIALYARLIAAEALRRSWTVRLLTTPSASESADFAEMMAALPAPVPVSLMPEAATPADAGRFAGHLGQVRLYMATRRGFREASRKFTPDVIYMINLDHFDNVLGVAGSPFGGTPFAGMLMRLTHGRRRMEGGSVGWKARVVERLFDRVVRMPELRRLAILDEQYHEYLRANPRPGYEKVRLVGDVGEVVVGRESRGEARRRLGIRDDAFVVLLYGTLSLRKGVREVLAAVAGHCAEPVVLVAAGRQDGDVRALMEGELAAALRSSGRLAELDGFQSTERERLLFASADVVWTAYVGRFARSSGVLYQAGSVGLPVLVSGSGLLGWRARRHDLGLVIDPGDAAATGAAIEELRCDGALRTRLGRAARKYAAAHSGKAFGEAVCTLIEEAAGR